MRYENMEPAIFLERPNRFVAYVEQAGRREICHVKNTGRCRELLVPGAELYVQRSDNPARKTPLDLISVKKGTKPFGDPLLFLLEVFYHTSFRFPISLSGSFLFLSKFLIIYY